MNVSILEIIHLRLRIRQQISLPVGMENLQKSDMDMI